MRKNVMKCFILAFVMAIMFSVPVFAASLSHTHSYRSWQTVSPATCTGTGVKVRSCKTCNAVQKSNIPKLGHKEQTAIVRRATCSRSGIKETSCSRCGKLLRATSINKLNHQWTGYRSTTTSERKKYGWSSIWFCRMCGKANGSYANY